MNIEDKIAMWNKERGLVVWDINLEMKLILEEAKEYYDAETLVDKFDAFLDLGFVAHGSAFKYTHNSVNNKEFEEFISLLGIIRKDFQSLINIYHEDFRDLANSGLEIVLKYNNKKSSEKNEFGKIIKPKDFVGPEKELQELLDSYMNKGENKND